MFLEQAESASLKIFHIIAGLSTGCLDRMGRGLSLNSEGGAHMRLPMLSKTLMRNNLGSSDHCWR